MTEIDLSALRGTLAYFGHVVYEPGSSLGPRTQRDVQLVMIDRGSVELTLDDDTHVIGPGKVFILWPGGRELFQFDRSRRTAHRWMTLCLADDDVTLQTCQRLRRTLPLVQVESATLRQLHRVGLHMDRQGVTRQSAAMVHMALAYLAGYMALGQQVQTTSRRPSPPPVAAAEKLMMERLAMPLTLDDLAHAASVTPAHLIRLFRQHRGTTPMRRLWEARVMRGSHLLRHTGLSVSQIAGELGFSSPFHFSRLMKQKLGHSPTQWRQKHWGRPGQVDSRTSRQALR